MSSLTLRVEEVWISSGTLEEGTDATISAIIRNDGTAKALIFEVGLECSGSEVLTTVNPIVELGPTEERIVTWDITSSKIDWWRQSVDGTCVVDHRRPIPLKECGRQRPICVQRRSIFLVARPIFNFCCFHHFRASLTDIV